MLENNYARNNRVYLYASNHTLLFQVIHRVSVAASPLAAWVKAIMAYSKVLEKTAPLENELSGLVASLQASH